MAQKKLRSAVAFGCGLGLTIVGLQTGGAQTAEQFYKGRAVTLVIPTATGGINDLSGRLVARHIGRFIPGTPAIVPQNRIANRGLGLLNDFASGAPRESMARSSAWFRSVPTSLPCGPVDPCDHLFSSAARHATHNYAMFRQAAS